MSKKTEKIFTSATKNIGKVGRNDAVKIAGAILKDLDPKPQEPDHGSCLADENPADSD